MLLQNFPVIDLFLLIFGFLVLIKGADYLIDGASDIAGRLGISEVVIGMTIIALGTSAPELVVNIMASLKGSSDIALGNVLGSNVANIFLGLGAAAIIFPVVVDRKIASVEIPMSVGAVVLLLGSIMLLSAPEKYQITRVAGGILVAAFVAFLIWTFKYRNETDDLEVHHGKSMVRASVGVIVGLGGLALGGHWIVEGSVTLSSYFGMSEALVGLTIVAIGTSLPEVATTVMAARKGKTSMAIGNIVGSNIFNLLWVLGGSSLILPLNLSQYSFQDMYIVIGVTGILMISLFLTKKRFEISKLWGYLFILGYLFYTFYLIFREGII
ncbi:MAG: calcium/sodium antiporter [Fibrobacterales bacterium]